MDALLPVCLGPRRSLFTKASLHAALIATVAVALSSGRASAQTAADSISITFPKVLVVNRSGDVVLVRDPQRQELEVPGATLEGPLSFKAYVDTLAQEIGVRYSSFRLGGVFSYVVPGRYRSVIRPYFVLQFSGYVNGTALADTSFRWVKGSDAARKIPYPASARIVERILTQPEHVWGGTFEEYGYTSPLDRSKIRFRVIEDLYRLD